MTDNPEIARLRREEHEKDAGNSIADAIVYDLMLAEPITNEHRRAAIETAKRMAPDLPLAFVTAIVDRVITNEIADRERIKRHRAARGRRRARVVA